MKNNLGKLQKVGFGAESPRAISRRRFLASAGALAAAVSTGPFFLKQINAQGLRKIKFTLPWLPMGHYAFLYAARDLGYWKKRGLDVTVDRGFGSGEAAKNVGLGTYDFGNADVTSMLLTAGRGGLDLMSLAMMSHISTLGLLHLKKSNIKKPKDLEGKVYGSSAGSVEVLMFPAFAKLTGIDPDKVKIVYMAPSALTPALLDGRIDTRGIIYPAGAPDFWVRKIDFDMLLFANYGLQLYSFTVMTTGKKVKEEPELCQNLVDGAMEALKLSYLDVEKTADVLMDAVPEYKGDPLARDTIKHAIGINAYVGYVDYVKEKGLGWHKPEIVEETRQKVMQYMDLKQAPPVEALYTNKFAGKVKLNDVEWIKFGELAAKYRLPA